MKRNSTKNFMDLAYRALSKTRRKSDKESRELFAGWLPRGKKSRYCQAAAERGLTLRQFTMLAIDSFIAVENAPVDNQEPI